jgi:ABC-type sugar transport system substrate-binding protein
LLDTLSHSFPNLQITQVPFPEKDDLNFGESNLQQMLNSSLRQFLQKQTDVTAVVALDENSTLAAWRVLSALPANKRPLLFGVSVEPDLLKACHAGKIAALAVQNPRKMGALSVQAILKFKSGNRPAPEISVPYQIIHAAR